MHTPFIRTLFPGDRNLAESRRGCEETEPQENWGRAPRSLVLVDGGQLVRMRQDSQSAGVWFPPPLPFLVEELLLWSRQRAVGSSLATLKFMAASLDVPGWRMAGIRAASLPASASAQHSS